MIARVFHIVLFRPEIPPNTGNLIRLCANVGATLHLVHPLGFALDEARVRRAGLDYHELACVREHADLPACLAALGEARIFALTTRAIRFYEGEGLLSPQRAGQRRVYAERERVRFDCILCPVGGGGLIAGTALAEKHFGSGAEVIAVEPDACDDMRRSLISHRRERNVGNPPTICDAMQAYTPGAVPFEAAAHLVSRGITVDDDTVRTAMRIAFEEFKIVLEPSGAIALAAALRHGAEFANRTVVLLCCGGSVSVEDLVRLTRPGATAS